MSKSPINILQEMMIKEGYAPKYYYSLDDCFKCEVTCKNLSASGTGINKREAKHNAALNILSLMNIKISSNGYQTGKMPSLNVHQTTCDNQSNNANNSSSTHTQMCPEYNYVGLLQELCIQYRLGLPLYELVNESGPSHMRTFTMRNTIGSLSSAGIAHCKRSAKQEAAKNALQCLIASNMLPKEAIKKLQSYKKIFQDNSQDITTDMSNIKITEPVSSIVASDKAQTSYIEPICNNITIQNITTVDNDSTGFNNNNNNTIKNTHINIYKTKSVETVNDYKHTLENNLKTFDMEKSVGGSTFVKQSEIAQSSYIESNSNSAKEQNLAIKNDHANLSSSVLVNNDMGRKRTIEDDLREFNIEITDHIESNKSTLPLTELSRKALSAYNTASGILENTGKCNPINICLTDAHNLFKKKYSSKISDDLKRRMHNVSKLSDFKSPIIQETYQDIQRALEVKLTEDNLNSNYRTGIIIICLRMLSTPVIAQFGIGATERDAKGQAMLAIINTILEYLK